MSERSLALRAARRALRSALSAPPSLLRRIVGPAPTNDRGHALDLQVQALLRAMVDRRKAADEVGVGRMRRDFDLQVPLVDFAPLPMHRVEDRFIPGADGAIRVRVYEPAPRRDRLRPMCLYFHGGGWVIGGLDGYDGLCRHLAKHADCVVVSVDYRLAPEHRFPAAPRDALAAYRWALERASDLGADPRRIAVAGDSAGGNLAAVVAQQTRALATPPIFQLLVYPATDLTRSMPSHRTYSTGYLLDEATILWFLDQYLSDPARDVHDPLGSPIATHDLRGVAPAYVVTAGFDPLRDEGEAYARKLEAAGVPTTLRCEESLVHGFVSMGGVIDEARRAVDRGTDALARALAGDR
ncbi:MAG: alpha/beta hydrolase [Myxococcota bacterium]|nr:alpha/beta hydrolase [Myxococcota bacterium]